MVLGLRKIWCKKWHRHHWYQQIGAGYRRNGLVYVVIPTFRCWFLLGQGLRISVMVPAPRKIWCKKWQVRETPKMLEIWAKKWAAGNGKREDRGERRVRGARWERWEREPGWVIYNVYVELVCFKDPVSLPRSEFMRIDTKYSNVAPDAAIDGNPSTRTSRRAGPAPGAGSTPRPTYPALKTLVLSLGATLRFSRIVSDSEKRTVLFSRSTVCYFKKRFVVEMWLQCKPQKSTLCFSTGTLLFTKNTVCYFKKRNVVSEFFFFEIVVMWKTFQCWTYRPRVPGWAACSGAWWFRWRIDARSRSADVA